MKYVCFGASSGTFMRLESGVYDGVCLQAWGSLQEHEDTSEA